MPSDLQRSPARRLSTRVVGALLASLLLGLLAIGSTLYLSWQLEGGAAAINAAGSLRKQTYRLALSLEEYAATPSAELSARVRGDLAVFDQTLTVLRTGDPARPLYLPHDEAVRASYLRVVAEYRHTILPPAQQVLAGHSVDRGGLRQASDDFVSRLNDLVTLVEQYNEQRTLLLQSSQVILIVMAVIGCSAQIILMFLLVFRPLERLQFGMQRMATHDLSVRLPVETRDEFGALAEGFNHMADRLSESYATLEARVEDKTALLNAQNRELSLLYGTTAWLNEKFSAQELSQGFAEHLRAWFKADACSVRVTDPSGKQAHLIAADGLPAELMDAEVCRQLADCYCGQAVNQETVAIQDFRTGLPEPVPALCARLGFAQVSAFPVRSRQQHVGLLTLFFATPHQFGPQEMQLLDSLGNHLGNALENQRLAASERELAVTQERNLLAQGLHDSIAQGLSFLNLQVQMLEDALRRGQLDEARELVPLLHAGVQESYDDVRDLLHNFRSRLGEHDLRSALAATLDKFRHQTGMATSFRVSGHGMPLPADLQIQVLFILQEALSNVRKHAHGADRVDVSFSEGPELSLLIADNGPGFAATLLLHQGDGHVGLRIMRERAARLGARLEFETERGVTVRLVMPAQTAQAEETS